MRKSKSEVEILYVAGSSRDDRGKRVLVREGKIENCIYPGEFSDFDSDLLGLSERDVRHIRLFLDGASVG